MKTKMLNPGKRRDAFSKEGNLQEKKIKHFNTFSFKKKEQAQWTLLDEHWPQCRCTVLV